LNNGMRDWGKDRMTAAEISDQEERNKGVGGRKLRAAWYAMTGDAPMLNPDDRDGAKAYLMKLSAAIARGRWTKNEWRRLKEQHLKWYRRANGLDPYFEAYGNKRQWADHGRTHKNKEDKRTFEAIHNIKEIVKQEIFNQKHKVEARGETAAERVSRLELTDRRFVNSEEFNDMD
jgi:putative protein kinase ArgK-like GTPase of G3E family